MKKLLTLILSLLWVIFFVWFSNVFATDCHTINYGGWNTACLSINKDGNVYTMSNGVNCPGGWCSLACTILLPNSELKEIWACNGSFTWNWASQWLVKIYTQFNWNRKIIERNYNFSAWTWWSSTVTSPTLNKFQLTTNKSNPSTNQWVDLVVKARDSNNNILTNYTNKIKFDVYYRSKTSASSSWTKTTSSTYFTINSSYAKWYQFKTYDYGQKSFYDFIKFHKNNLDYKIRVYDEDNPGIYKEIIFYISIFSSDIAWFSVKEVEMIQRIYTLRPQLIRQLKVEHPRFNTNTVWKNLWNDLYSNMKDVLDNKVWRKFTNYNKFFSDFMVWYKRTLDVIH
jgi:hypothetical protein